MPHPGLVAHYQHLLGVAQYLDVALSWTVVQPLGDLMDIEDIVERLRGPDFELREVDLEEAGLLVDESGPSIMFLDHVGGIISQFDTALLERLSTEARLWHLTWNVNGHSHLLYGADGRIRLWMPGLDPNDAHGPDSHALDHLLPPSHARLSHAAAMALIDQDSGAHLDLEWLNSVQREVSFGAD